MQICKVVGTVVSTNKTEKLSGFKLLIVQPMDLTSFQPKSEFLVTVDTVGAGEGEIVMIVGGSSARQTATTEGKPVDNAIVAIIDHVDISGKKVFDRTR
jgi:microcompartment protein CcmK/EutM